MIFKNKIRSYHKICFFLFLSFSAFTQGFENEIRAYEKLDSIAMPAKGMRLFIGSSSFALWNTFNADMKGLNAINRGFGGSILKDALYYFDRMVVKYQPSWVFLYEGDNDLMSGKSPQTIAAEFEEFSTRLAVQVPGAKLVYVFIRPSLAREAIRVKQKELNKRIEDIVVKKKGHFVIDMHSPFYNLDGSLMQDIFVSDKLHLNEKGYKIFAQQIKNFIHEQNNSVKVKITGLKDGDTCNVQIQKSIESLYFKKLSGISNTAVEHTFQILSNGKWSLKLAATGYYLPAAQEFELTGSPIAFEIRLIPKITGSTLEESVFYIYPNPARDKITTISDQVRDIEIVNSLGMIIQQIASIHPGDSIDLSKYSVGKYFIRFMDKNLKSVSIPIVSVPKKQTV